MKWIKYITATGLFLMAFSCLSQEEGYKTLSDPAPFIEKVKAYSLATNTIQSNFKQEKHLTMLEEVLISEGHFIFQKEDNVVWEYTNPISYAIIVHNGKFIIRDGEKVKEFDIQSNRMFKEINNMIVTSVSGNFLDNPDFQASYMENNEFYLARLIPLKPEVKDMLSEIDIYFDKKEMQVAKVKFKEPGDDFTLIVFSNKVFNEPIPEEVFNVSQ